MGPSTLTLDNLFLPQVGLELRGLMYHLKSTKYTWHARWNSIAHVNLSCQSWHKNTNVRPLAAEFSTNKLSLTSYYLNILQSSYHVTSMRLSLSSILFVTLSISHYYPLAIIYKSIIVCKGCYPHVTTPTNKDPQLPLYTIDIRFLRTLFIYSLILS